MLLQRNEFNAKRDAMSYPEIPESHEFQCPDYSYKKPAAIHGWQWSTTFNRWTALVTFADGWHGYTWPKV